MAITIFYPFPNYPYQNANEELKKRVWEKAEIIENVHPDHIRSDPFGMAICYSEHGNRNSDLGWEMVQLIGSKPVDGNDMTKLVPVNWRMNHREQQN